jgi:hypothetical protein
MALVETLLKNPVGSSYTQVGAKNLSEYPLGLAKCE